MTTWPEYSAKIIHDGSVGWKHMDLTRVGWSSGMVSDDAAFFRIWIMTYESAKKPSTNVMIKNLSKTSRKISNMVTHEEPKDTLTMHIITKVAMLSWRTSWRRCDWNAEEDRSNP